MQISKLMLAVCAVMAGAVALPVQGADTDAQAKAREALRQKMNEAAPAAQPAPAAPEAAPVAPAPEAPKAPKAKKAPKAPVAPVAESDQQVTSGLRNPPAPILNTPPAADPDAIAKARDAMRQKMSELEKPAQAVIPAPPVEATQRPVVTQPAQPPVVTQPAPPPVTTQPAQPPVAVQPTPEPAPTAAAPTINFPPSADPEAIAKARDAMRNKMNSLEAETPQPAPPVAAKPPKATKPAPEPAQPTQQPEVVAKPQAPKHAQGFQPLEGPPSPISVDKQQQLSELLRRYRADELTPEQYHLERAKILGPQ